jgi:2-polyprenyl-6-hydroxyphenyl methylase/3-demethylubiquinone-9 3-methyltransferase
MRIEKASTLLDSEINEMDHMNENEAKWDTGSHQDFYAYYEQQSLSQETIERFKATRDALLRLKAQQGNHQVVDVLDIGCGAGTQSMLWSEKGHRYVGIDINEPLIILARKRCAEHGFNHRFEVGSATELPFPDASFDICVMPELLEHVPPWQDCLREAMRCLRPDGLLYISTNNTLCPIQSEFNLPIYSWYPKILKNYFERRAVTDWPELVNFAKYPAVNWFSFYSLKKCLQQNGFDSYDRIDMIDFESKTRVLQWFIGSLKALPPLRWLAHVATPYTVLIAKKHNAS